eukprot:2883370-Rhodomonas_salina.1
MQGLASQLRTPNTCMCLRWVRRHGQTLVFASLDDTTITRSRARTDTRCALRAEADSDYANITVDSALEKVRA